MTGIRIKPSGSSPANPCMAFPTTAPIDRAKSVAVLARADQHRVLYSPAPLITPSVVDLPTVGKGKKPPEQVIEVIVGKDDTLSLKIDGNTQRIKLGELAANVKRAQDGLGKDGSSAVIISADKNVKYETVVRVMDTLQKAGAQRVGLSVQVVN